ncbi:MAG: 3-keto-5-aminohexanoate cleavage protein [Pseudomonadota bacterium]
MVAPNGARKTTADHPALPIALPDIVATAVDCHAAGAGGLHLHVRDEEGQHSLDVGRYREALTELRRAVPGMALQITTEAVGRYPPLAQRAVVTELKPDYVSISLKEMLADGDHATAMDFYRQCVGETITVQHILYDPSDLQAMSGFLESGQMAGDDLQLLYVLGRYTDDQQSDPDDLKPFIDWLRIGGLDADWAVCAFGTAETACLTAALNAGGKVRVGFENSFWNADGTLAQSNAERVAEISAIASKLRAAG